MLRKPFIRMVVLSCIAFSVGCAGTEEGVGAGANTGVNLLISDPDAPPEEILLLIDFVSYRITCPASGLAPFDDSLDLAGNFEVDASADPPVWEMATDLPLSPVSPPGSGCTISLWVFHEDEVVCSGDELIPIVDDGDPLTQNKVNIVLECNLSVNTPSADLDIDGSFEFINGNYCPKLNWLGALPPVVEAAVPAETIIEALAFDPDSTCGLNCDPQTCDFTQTPPLCTAAPDPGFTTRFFAPAGHESFDPSFVMGMTPMQGGTPIDAQSTYTCDPLFPGPTEICVVASDGDNDCDQVRCITIVCPDLCANVDCDDGNECTRDRCDPLSGLCSNDPAPDGIACDACISTCQSGACDAGSPFVADFVFTGAIAIDGQLQQLDTTFVNPYSGSSVAAIGIFYVNQSSFLGASAFDTLAGTGLQDILLAQTPSGDQAICDVERVFSLNGFDVLRLADEFIVLGDTEIQGGSADDVLWANVGNDLLRGNDGQDLLDGGPGNDTIFGETGDDTITLWPGSGFDSIDGGNGLDQVVVDAEQNQITITPAANGSYEFDITYLATPMAQIIRAELLVLNDAVIDLAACTAGVCNLCGNDALNGGEGCDDGNNVDGDGCGADCTAEY